MKNLVIVRAGDTSCHPSWLEGGKSEFDFWISYYGDTPGRFKEQASYYECIKGAKWPPICDLLDLKWRDVYEYDYVCIPDDDLIASAADWNKLFELTHKYSLDISQPSLDGHINWPITKHQNGKILRYVNRVEIMTPLFSRRVYDLIFPTFKINASCWGLDALWGKMLPYPTYKLAVIDAVIFRHTRKGGTGPLVDVFKAMKVDSFKEADEIEAKYGCKVREWFSYGEIVADGV